MTADEPVEGPVVKVVHRTNRRGKPICSAPYPESGSSMWTSVTCPDCTALMEEHQ